MTDSKKTSSREKQAANFVEKRHEKRYGVPDRCQRYMTLHLKSGDRKIPAILANFSRSGILFETTVPLENGSRIEGVLSLSLLLTRAVSFWINVRYCYKNNNSYIIGAEIDKIADNTWFDFFEEIYDFIVLRNEAS